MDQKTEFTVFNELMRHPERQVPLSLDLDAGKIGFWVEHYDFFKNAAILMGIFTLFSFIVLWL